MIKGTKVHIPSTTVVKIEIDLPTAKLIADALGWKGHDEDVAYYGDHATAEALQDLYDAIYGAVYDATVGPELKGAYD